MNSRFSNAIYVREGENGVSNSNDPVLHLLPCKVKCTCDALDENEQRRCRHVAKVDDYFTPIISEVNRGDENKQYSASFRGRPLRGAVVDVPEGYRGVVLKDNGNSSELRLTSSSVDQVRCNIQMFG